MKNTPLPLVIAILVASQLAACGPSTEAVRSKAEYMHDLDAAEALNNKVNSSYANLEKYANHEGARNARSVVNGVREAELARECWPKNERPSTANTDHDCLDRLGFKR